MHASLRVQTTYYNTKLEIKPDFPCLANGIAEPRTGMNVKVAAITVSEKSINIYLRKIRV